MSEDRLAEIEEFFQFMQPESRVHWLIAEVKRLREALEEAIEHIENEDWEGETWGEAAAKLEVQHNERVAYYKAFLSND